MKSTKALLESLGYTFIKDGRNWFTTSPLNPDDKDPSFAIFPDGGWYCFSTRQGGHPSRSGSVENLARLMHVNVPELPTWVPVPSEGQKPWDNTVPEPYLNISPVQEQKIREYATSRGVVSGYIPAVYYSTTGARPSMMFPHGDGITITGGNFRDIRPETKRYSMRGELNFYVLENGKPEHLYLVEGEINANSLWEYCKATDRQCVILSAGSVNRIPAKLPKSYVTLKGSLLIDYDGSETKWKQRIKNYKHLELNPIKMCLPSKQDINSLWQEGKLNLIEHLI